VSGRGAAIILYQSLTDATALIRKKLAGERHRPAIISRVAPMEQLTVTDVVANPVLAEVIRSGFVESRHRGTVVALAADGTFAFTAGIANAPVFPQSFPKTPARLSSIARQPDEDVEEEQDGDDGDGDVEMERPGRTPTPPYVSLAFVCLLFRSHSSSHRPSPPKGKRTRPTTRSERKSAEYVEDSDNESVPASKVSRPLFVCLFSTNPPFLRSLNRLVPATPPRNPVNLALP